MRFLRFRAWLGEMNALLLPINVIYYEQAHQRGGAATQLAYGMITDVLAFAADKHIETAPVHTAKLKKFATGSGRANKDDMIDAARRAGYGPQDDNEADAIWLREYAIMELGGGVK